MNNLTKRYTQKIQKDLCSRIFSLKECKNGVEIKNTLTDLKNQIDSIIRSVGDLNRSITFLSELGIDLESLDAVLDKDSDKDLDFPYNAAPSFSNRRYKFIFNYKNNPHAIGVITENPFYIMVNQWSIDDNILIIYTDNERFIFEHEGTDYIYIH